METLRKSAVTIRPAEREDADAIAATLRAAFAAFEALYTPPAFEATTPTTEQLADRFGDGPVWVAERDGRVLGTVSAIPRGRELYTRSMAVLPSARRQGVGAQLLHTAERFAVLGGYRRLSLTTTPLLSAAIQLYERLGFHRTGERADLHGTPLLWMAKALGPQKRGGHGPQRQR